MEKEDVVIILAVLAAVAFVFFIIGYAVMDVDNTKDTCAAYTVVFPTLTFEYLNGACQLNYDGVLMNVTLEDAEMLSEFVETH